MLHECPNCRETISYWRMFRTPAWGSFRCKACGSVLTVSFARRLVACGLWFAFVWIAMERLGFFRSWPRLVLYPLMVVSIVGVFYLYERIILLERRAFTCRKCGYDLQGLPEPKCPECGTSFDPNERERILARISTPPPKPRYRWIAAIVVTLLALIIAGSLVAYRRAGGTLSAPVPAAP